MRAYTRTHMRAHTVVSLMASRHRVLTKMAARVSPKVTQGGTAGSTWCCISPTRPEVMLPVAGGVRTPSRDPRVEGGVARQKCEERVCAFREVVIAL